jgi:hypothetical protein
MFIYQDAVIPLSWVVCPGRGLPGGWKGRMTAKRLTCCSTDGRQACTVDGGLLPSTAPVSDPETSRVAITMAGSGCEGDARGWQDSRLASKE